MKEILKGVHQLGLGGVNAFIVDHGDLTLVDSGHKGSWKKISAYLKKIGKTPSQIKNILITHVHSDHTGGLAEVKKATGAKVFMNEVDADLINKGQAWRNVEISPGVVHKIVFRLFIKNGPRTVTPVETDQHIDNGNVLPFGKGFEVITAPGHCKGQVVFLYQDFGGLLFAADTCGNMFGLDIAPFYEDINQGYKDLQNLSLLEFNHAAFGHGKPLRNSASEKFRKRFDKLNK